ncbi:MAG: hypothetical protein ABIH82_00585 [Candidatus Woesearchaeota archaeon]
MVQINLIIGILGMLCILIAFVLDEFVKKYNTNSYLYNILNIIGAGMLLYYGLTLRGWPFVILNAIWVVAAVIKLVELLKK